MAALLAAPRPSSPANAGYVVTRHLDHTLPNIQATMHRRVADATYSPRPELIADDINTNILLENVVTGIPNLTIIQPVIPSGFNTSIPVYIGLMGTDLFDLYSVLKDVDLLLDHRGRATNWMTAFSDDAALVIARIRQYVFQNPSQIIEICSHSLGCQYAQAIYLDSFKAPSWNHRITSISMFNPYMVYTTGYEEMRELCINSSTIRDLINVHVVENDFASALMIDEKAYGNVNVYPEAIDEDSTRYMLGLESTSQEAYRRFDNHSLEIWGTTDLKLRPITRSFDDLQLTQGRAQVHTLLAKAMPRHFGGSSLISLRLEGKSIREFDDTSLQVNYPSTSSDSPDAYNFSFTPISLGDGQAEYFIYDDLFGSRRVAQPVTMSTTTDSVVVWLYNFGRNPLSSGQSYMIMTRNEAGNYVHLRMPPGSYDALSFPFTVPFRADIDAVINEVKDALSQIVPAPGLDDDDIIQGKLAEISKQRLYMAAQWTLQPPVLDATMHTELRRDEASAMAERQWKIQSQRSLQYLVMGEAVWNQTNIAGTVRDGREITYLSGVDTQSHSLTFGPDPDECIWTLLHTSGDLHYTLQNTKALSLLGSWIPLYTDQRDLSTQSDYGMTDVVNTSIFMQHVSDDATGSLFHLYVMYNGKRQYLVPMAANFGADDGPISLVSEDYFDPTGTNASLTDYSYNGGLTEAELFSQFVWKFWDAQAPTTITSST